MSRYQNFAEVYDLFMDGVPYDRWAENITEILSSHAVRDGLVLDLCCGTGQMTRRLAFAGYDMIGVDLSEDMLSLARSSGGDGILYLHQDMRSFELYGTVRAVVSVCDSMNYLESKEELFQVFSLVENYLDPGGLFLFDLNTAHKYRDLLGDRTFAENREEGSFIWENTYSEETGVNEFDLTFYVKEQGESYRRFEEVHLQRSFSMREVEEMLSQASLRLLAIHDLTAQEEDPDAPMKESVCAAEAERAERVLFVAQETRKGRSSKEG